MLQNSTKRKLARVVRALVFIASMPYYTGQVIAGESIWPNKPIHVFVAFPAGGISDVLMRIIGAQISPILGQPIIVEPRPGADGNIAAELVAKSQADGYTWLLTSVPFAVQVTLRPRAVKYDPVRDFEAVANISSSPNVFVVPAALPVGTLQEFVAYAKGRAPPPSFASPGNGTGSHLGMELFNRDAQVNLLHIPYKGQPAALTDLIAGRVDCASMAISMALPYIRSGKLKALAVIDGERNKDLPNVPSIAEAGYPSAVAVAWQALMMPAHTPREIVDRVNKEVMTALQTPDVIEKLHAIGLTPAKPNRPEDVSALIKAEIVRWRQVINETGIKAD